MKIALCSVCHHNPSQATCGICALSLCKKCQQFVEVDAFSFREKVAPELTRGHYCAHCYTERLEPEMAKYQETMEAARKVFIFHALNPLPRSLKKKSNKIITVPGCKDKDETYLRLGFLAAEKGYNAVVETTVERTEKKRSIWSGTGVPAHIDAVRQARFED